MEAKSEIQKMTDIEILHTHDWKLGGIKCMCNVNYN